MKSIILLNIKLIPYEILIDELKRRIAEKSDFAIQAPEKRKDIIRFIIYCMMRKGGHRAHRKFQILGFPS